MILKARMCRKEHFCDKNSAIKEKQNNGTKKQPKNVTTETPTPCSLSGSAFFPTPVVYFGPSASLRL